MARVLIVDDDPRITELLADFVADLGHEVATANEGDGAFADFQKHPPALIITDYHMPGGSGAELVARIRAAKGGSAVSAIVMSGSAAEEDPGGVSAFPRLRYLVKPVDLEALKSAIEELLAS